MAKPKTRIVVNYENHDRALFSVRENGDQSLTIIFQSPTNYEEEVTDTNIAILHHKISVHLSPSSPGTTLLRTLHLENGRTQSSAQYIKDSKTSLFCLTFSMLMPQLGADRYLLKARNRDTIVRVGTFNASDLTSLIYHIVVADNLQTIPPLAGHSLSVIKFSRWKIGVYCTYLNIFSGPFGVWLLPITSPIRNDGVDDPEYPKEDFLPDGIDPLSVDRLADHVIETDNMLAFGLVAKIHPVTPEAEKQQLMDHRYMFHPNVESFFAERMGAPSIFAGTFANPSKPPPFRVNRPKFIDKVFSPKDKS